MTRKILLGIMLTMVLIISLALNKRNEVMSSFQSEKEIIVLTQDDDFSSGYVNVILPPIEGEKCTTNVLRSCLIIDEEFDLSRNQTDESEEELGPF